MRTLSTLLAALTIFVLADGVLAQDYKRADHKFYRPQTARTYQRHAINHAQTLRNYGQSNVTVPVETAKEHATEIRRNLNATQKELAKLAPEVKNDKVARELLTQIRSHHSKAAAACDMLDAVCAKASPEGVAIANCCTDMVTELQAADRLHDQLMQHLGVAVPAPKK
jgi:hypothetical protein